MFELCCISEQRPLVKEFCNYVVVESLSKRANLSCVHCMLASKFVMFAQ